MAAPRQGLPVRLERAPHRGAAFALSNASKRARTRSIGSRSRGSLFIGSRSRGSLFIFRSSPRRRSPWPRLQIEALQNQLVGIERAITLMNGGVDPAQPSSSNGRERARNVKDTVLGLLAEAGEAGLTVTKCVEMAQKRGSHLERGTVSSLPAGLKQN